MRVSLREDEAFEWSRGGLTTGPHLSRNTRGRPLPVSITASLHHESTKLEVMSGAIREMHLEDSPQHPHAT